MGFVLKFKKGEKANVEQVALTLHNALTNVGVSLRDSEISEREDSHGMEHVLFVMGYDGREFDVMYRDRSASRVQYPRTALFDQMGTDEVDSFVNFNKTDGGFLGLGIVPADKLEFEPSELDVAFLRKVGKKVKENLPQLELLAVSYQLSRYESYQHELL